MCLHSCLFSIKPYKVCIAIYISQINKYEAQMMCHKWSFLRNFFPVALSLFLHNQRHQARGVLSRGISKPQMLRPRISFVLWVWDSSPTDKSPWGTGKWYPITTSSLTWEVFFLSTSERLPFSNREAIVSWPREILLSLRQHKQKIVRATETKVILKWQRKSYSH